MCVKKKKNFMSWNDLSQSPDLNAVEKFLVHVKAVHAGNPGNIKQLGEP